MKFKPIGSPMTIIEVSADNHIDIIESLAREIWSEHYDPIISKQQVDYMLARFQSKQAINEQIASGALYFLIEEGLAFIGYFAVQPRVDELFLSKIYLRSNHRASGYGKKAVQFVEKLAREQGLRKVALTVNKSNTGAIRAYEKIGFRNVGSLVQDIGGGFVMDDYAMEKNV
jgi:ribosomal protein S18 acetylase RimI-like enzyme